MDLQKPLEELVTKVPGALGAILIDSLGEAVTYFITSPTLPANTEEVVRLRLIGAYHRVWINDCAALAREFQLGDLQNLVRKYDYGVVLAKALSDNHALILITTSEAFIGQGLLHLNKTGALLEADF